jgi:methionyl-tRNA formyltransferase
MKIEFLTQEDPIYLLPFFDEFFRHYASEFEVVQVSCCPVMGKRSRWKMIRELTCLYGGLGFVRLGFQAVGSRALSVFPGRQRFYTIEHVCHAFGVPYKRIGNPNSADFVEEIRRRAPDLVLSVACPFIFKQALLNVAPLGCINVHHAPLPRYRGMMPTFWQMFHGERVAGLTVHYVNAEIDKGDVLLRDNLTIEPGESLDHLIRRSKRHAAHSMATVARQIGANTQRVIKMPVEDGSYFTFPTLDEIREFRRRGLRAI